jgi:hypothetical protein
MVPSAARSFSPAQFPNSIKLSATQHLKLNCSGLSLGQACNLEVLMASAGFGKRGIDISDIGATREAIAVSHVDPIATKEQRDRRLRSIASWLFGVTATLFVVTALLPSPDDGSAVAQDQPLPTRDGWTVVSTEKIAIQRPSEPQATYAVIGVAKTADGKAVAMNTRYSQQSGWNYTMRGYDCERGKLFTYGSGTTFEEMQVYRPDPHWGQLIDGSSATQVAAIACRMIGKTLSGVQ